MLADDLTAWYEAHLVHLRRAAEIARQDLGHLIEDWAVDHKFRVEASPEVRIKGASRLLEKMERKGLEDPAALLQDPYPIRDIVGARIIVRGSNDYEALRLALAGEVLEWTVLETDDKRRNPSKTGYRALHLDCLVTTKVKLEELKVPIELQVKTLAQKVWGEYTHDAAYAMGAVAGDARFQVVRDLQATVAEHLELVDVLQGTIERMSADVLHGIAQQPSTDDVDVASVLNLFFVEASMVVPLGEAQMIVELCRYIGIDKVEPLRELMTSDTEEASDIADEWRANHGGVSPTPPEVVIELLKARQPGGDVDTAG